jgi:hypothetical protein
MKDIKWMAQMMADTVFEKIKTFTPAKLTSSRPKSDEDEAPQSVIHAPSGFSEFVRDFAFRKSPGLTVILDKESRSEEKAIKSYPFSAI